MTHSQTSGQTNTDKDKKMERKFNKMESKTQLKKSGPAKPVYKAGAKENLIQDITNRFRVTAREARDIVTAVANVGKSAQVGRGSNMTKNALGNLAKQVGETGRAAATGRKGTESEQTRKSGSGNAAQFRGSSRADKSIPLGVGSVDKIAKNWQKADEKANKVKRK
jgi:hypothetical protein